ncbi:PREDICTED: putative receptor-like protein kinase At3g47110 [Erythranthe guttata]|uniref:putative receptor-like protein kinase At3g47110 n=1 Tax=Erythranthe guttata TaxID=4155 RepID=UPI00064D9FF2|nr:PREDICTED: putative receptor-like protein kinase At3g47110 [Erythranthe guttata]|eukprot:XP_012850959.1 PREDICTED: putative receptor-like protein kinase At3g47110 [Erythranthe guttata]
MANSIIITLYLLAFSCFALYTPASSSSNQTDLLSLLALKEALSVDPNGALNSWNRSTNFCTWNGVTCGRRHPNRVIAINLDSQGLMGSLSPHIGNLSFLRKINLGNNIFNSRIPQEFGILRRLEYIEFSNNSFMGRIVPENISQWRNLVYLNLINNNLSGPIPPEIQFLEKLRDIGLGKNKISGPIPHFFGNLTSLRTLYLRSCGLEGEIPQSFSQLEGLSYINLGDNNLIGTIPLGMFNISTIKQFEVDFNDIHGTIPSTIGLTLPNQKLLVLGKNQFSGRVPISLSNVSSLELLVLSVNNFNGIMPRFGGLSNLDSLYAAETLIEDDISFISSLTYCTSLRVLDLGDNPLITGSIPDTIANMSTLFDRLGIYGTQIVGRIPAGIGNLICLTRLQLSYNNLEGPIPLSIGRLFNLRVLNLEDNRITSDAPSAFGNLTLLYSLSLQRNNFSGIIPTSLANCTNMRELDLSRNNFIGPIPREILIPTSFVFLNLSYNALTGSIPEEVGSLTKVEVLDFSNNRLSGLVPNSLGMCNSLEWLHLEDLLHATNGFSEYNILGRGRFGSVYKGIIDNGHTFLAVKILNLFVKGASKSFMAECNALSGIRHKNVVKMLSVCESVDFQGNDFKALIYEFKANGSLDKWLYCNREQEKGQSETQLRYLDIKQRLNIAIDIAQAVEYLHCGTNSTIVHGDLKPSNILLDQDMTAYVGDFGLAKIISSIHSSQESSGTIGIRGTIGYVPPEYGTSNTITTKGDVYSYGILVLEMFTNRRPTDDSFMDHVNLHNFVVAALPDRVMEIVDSLIRIGPHQNSSKIEDFMASIISIGVSCSKEVPRERMLMKDVINELQKIQKELCG